MNWLVSDTHFNHANIIRYCDRPFSSVDEMNQALVDNWNRVVEENDTVFFLGDLASGYRPLDWLKMLNGHIVLIKGSHDRFVAPKTLTLHSGGIDMLLIHNPADVPESWKGWVVHGHKHNTVPFFDPARKRVNVSVEVIDYTPTRVSRVMAMIREADVRSQVLTQPRLTYTRTRPTRRRGLSLPQLRGVAR